ncbi:YdbH domain-containing protein [Pseudomonas sp. UBA2684]|uniref:YdbH domain-containing protein n=1 Tax=Pseudomonas sp. UBA2684 TaxID=1947311 RepID=UPI000E9E6428|nr:YdbH domain-containing protein [Pseudomonas sp. UBA2684]HBX54192.1 hypothetical protein [Pseudomonas sp.]
MISRRNWLRITSVLTLLMLLGGASYFSWTRLLERQHIRDFAWQGLSLSRDGIHLAHLALLQHTAAGQMRIQAEHLHLSWRQFSASLPLWQHIRLGRLTVAWHPAADSPAAAPSSTPVDLEQLGSWLTQVPRSLGIDDFSAELPCASGRCTLQGDLQLLKQAQTPLDIQLQLTLRHDDARLAWSARLQGEAEALELQLALAINDQAQLGLHSSVHNSPTGPLWRGNLSAPNLSQTAVLQDWLSEWALPLEYPAPNAPNASHLAANWHLQLTPGALDLERLRTATGQLDASLTLPEPWTLPGLGRLQGNFTLAARALNGQWFAEQLSADLQLDELTAAQLRELPEALRPTSLHLNIQPTAQFSELPSNLAERALPLAIQLSSSGPSSVELHAKLALANAPPWALQVVDAQLAANSTNLAFDSWTLSNLQARLELNGYLDGEHLNLHLKQGSQLSLGQLSSAELHLQQLLANTTGLQLRAQLQAGRWRTWQLDGPTRVTAQRIEHASLTPQGWRWHGQLTASEERIALNGQLATDGDLQLNLQLQQNPGDGLLLSAQLPEVFLRAGNPLAKTLAAWPALLDLNNGRLSANATLRLAANRTSPEIQLELSSTGLAGIYDRTALSGLDGHLQLSLEQQRLHLVVDSLRLEQADPGIPIGPLQLRGRYDAVLAQLDKGRLQLHQAQSAVMGGTLQLNPGEWNLAQDSLLFPLQLQGLELERFFTLYPAEGLAGNGLIDGHLPLRIGANSIVIEQGQLTARQPGGRLQFHSERIRALGRSNPAMQLVTQSLEDFRFTTLSSQVNYDQQGKLSLGMRLEGQNPAIEQGRPIHFNINLEEDIPTLLASLQLTDKVNEIIKRRVQQRMLERNAATAPKEP